MQESCPSRHCLAGERGRGETCSGQKEESEQKESLRHCRLLRRTGSATTEGITHAPNLKICKRPNIGNPGGDYHLCF